MLTCRLFFSNFLIACVVGPGESINTSEADERNDLELSHRSKSMPLVLAYDTASLRTRNDDDEFNGNGVNENNENGLNLDSSINHEPTNLKQLSMDQLFWLRLMKNQLDSPVVRPSEPVLGVRSKMIKQYVDEPNDSRSFDIASAIQTEKRLANLRSIRAGSRCLKRGFQCEPSATGSRACCPNSTCRCNLWGDQCRCQRMGLLQRWG